MVAARRDSSSAKEILTTDKRYFWPPQNDSGKGKVNDLSKVEKII